MKNLQIAAPVGFALSVYIICKALTETNEDQSQFYAAMAIFLMLYMIKNMQKA